MAKPTSIKVIFNHITNIFSKKILFLIKALICQYLNYGFSVRIFEHLNSVYKNFTLSMLGFMNDDRQQKLAELKKQRDELDKLIAELTEATPIKTNIPYSQLFLKKYPSHVTAIDLQSMDPKELLQIRMFVNKKCNQVSTSFEHTISLANEIIPYKTNNAFREIFIRKVLDQGRVQVSGHLESYKPFSFLLLNLNCPEMIESYIKLLILKEGNEMELKGMYAIYFGYLNLKEDVDECWFWCSSVLNEIPNLSTGYIIELFLIICGDLLAERIPNQFIKLLKYIETYFLKEIDNTSVIQRLSTILMRLRSKFA